MLGSVRHRPTPLAFPNSFGRVILRSSHPGSCIERALIAVVSAVDPLLRASASAVNRLRDGVGRGIVRASAQRWVNTTAHRYRTGAMGQEKSRAASEGGRGKPGSTPRL